MTEEKEVSEVLESEIQRTDVRNYIDLKNSKTRDRLAKLILDLGYKLYMRV